MTNPRASNWVDRGLPPDRKLARCLAAYLNVDFRKHEPVLRAHATTMAHMVAADASEVQVTSYLRSVESEFSVTIPEGPLRRTMAIALWHIAKAAQTRDRLLSLAANPPGPPTSEQVPLSTWLAERLLRDDPRVDRPAPPSTGQPGGMEGPRDGAAE